MLKAGLLLVGLALVAAALVAACLVVSPAFSAQSTEERLKSLETQIEQLRKDLAQGRARRIDYDLKRGTVELAGDAWLTDGKTEITGEKLVYSTANQRVVSQEQVLITIQPGEVAPDKPKPEP